jgi:Ala-tRNA(Pro) deacylase
MPGRKLQDFLDARNIKYLVSIHSPGFSAQEIAARMHVHGWEFAKSVVVRASGKLMMVVLSAPLHVDFEKLRRLCSGDVVDLVTEDELAELFPGNEIGAMPPFGNLYGMPVVVDRRLAEQSTIVFNAGSHSEAIRMSFTDYQRLVEPMVADVGEELPPWRPETTPRATPHA